MLISGFGFIGRIEGKTDREKQRIAYFVGLTKWMSERVLGENNKNPEFIKTYKRQVMVESYDRIYPDARVKDLSMDLKWDEQ